MSFTLVMNDGKGAGKCFSYTKERVSIGRLKENDLVLYNTGVSRTHCIITMRSSEKYGIEDAGSSNGTVVNGQRITSKVALRDNDIITVGPVTFQFKIGDTMPGERNADEHYEETIDVQAGNLGIQSNQTQALSAEDVKRARAAINIAREAQAAAAAGSSAVVIHNPPAPAKPIAAEKSKSKKVAEEKPAPVEPAAGAEGEPVKKKRVTGQRRMAAEGSAAGDEGAPTKRVTGDPARRARLEQAKQQAANPPEPEPVEEIKEVTAKVKPRVPFTVWFKEQPKNKKIMIIGGAAVGLLLIGGGIVAGSGGEGSSFTDNSDTVFTLNPANSNRSYGLGKNINVSCRDKVSFSFDYNGGLAVLRYSVAGIDSPNELAIYTNKQLVGYAPVSSRWMQDVQLKIPSAMLKAHSKNIITFDSTNNPPGTDKWGVRQITIQEKSLPEPDPDRAMHFYTLAQEAYKSYLVDPANLSTAIGHYNDALVFLERLDPKPPLYGQIEVALKEAEEVLQKIYDDKIYQSYREIRSRNNEEARNILNELLRYLPNQEDRRRQEVQNRLKNLGQQ